MILHITTSKEWEQAQLAGEYITPSLSSDGFIHCSTPRQVVDTANLFFKGQSGLILLCIDENKLIPECKFEDPTGGGDHDPVVGKFFPHVYGPINLSAVLKVIDFPADENGIFEMPEDCSLDFFI